MPTHALLGATGGTGAAVLRAILKDIPSPDYHLRVLVRNKNKLLDALPRLESTDSSSNRLHIEIIEAGLDDQEALKKALWGAEIIYSCIATNTSNYGVSVAIDTAKAVIGALKTLQAQQGKGYVTPTVLMLRSCNLAEVYAGPDPLNKSWNPVIMGLKYVYADLDEAAKLYEATVRGNPGLLEYIFVDPVSIHDPEGTELTGYELSTTERPETDCISYADLGAAFWEIASRKEEFIGKAVMVNGTGKVNQNWPPLLANIAGGVASRITHLS